MPGEPQRATAKVLSQDRRQFARQPIDSLACIFLSAEGGGVVVNVSEGGMALYSSLGMDSASLESLRFQLPPSLDWIEARGKIAWATQTKKLAGFQFEDLSESARTQIRDWISLHNPPRASAKPSKTQTPGPQRTQAAAQRPARKPKLVRRPPASALRTPAPLGEPGQAPSPSAQVDEPRRPVDDLERALRRFFANRRELPVASAMRKERLPKKFVAAISLLVMVSFAVGLFVSRHRPSASSDDGTDSAYSVSADGPASPNGESSEPTESQPKFAGVLATTAKARFTVTSEIHVPGSREAADVSQTRTLKVGKIERRVDPEYPAAALASEVEGTVELRAQLAPDGAVRSVVAISGPPLLVSSALSAVKSWRYSPTLLSGEPVGAEANIAIVFWLPPHPVESREKK